MAFLSVDQGSAMYDATPVENMFLLEYLPSAQDDYLRVYLYARMAVAHPELAGGVADIARALRLTEETVEDAMRFWEREGLVKRLSDRPPTYALFPMRAAGRASEMDRQYYQFRDFNAALQRLFGEVILHGEISIPQDWVNVFGYSPEAALKIVEYGLNGLHYSRKAPRATLRRLDGLAREWSERGARTLEDVERLSAEKNGELAVAEAVVKRFGQRRRPTEDELNLARKWLGWGFSPQEIVDSCATTTKAQTPSFGYLDSVLAGRRKETDGGFEALKAVLRELGAPVRPTPETQRKYAEFLQRGFDARTVEIAAASLNAENRHRFESLEDRLAQWQEKGLLRADAAEAYLQRRRALKEEMMELLRHAGSDRAPGEAEIDLYEGWKARFSAQMLRLAAEMARGSAAAAVGAIDKLLSQWEQEGVSTPEQARARRERPAKGFDNPALHYEQRAFEGDGDEMFTDLSQYRGDGV